MTGINQGQFQAEGWTPISDSTLYAEKGYYIQLNPMYAAKGQIWTVTIQIPIYSLGVSANNYIFRLWVVDLQPPFGATASGTTVPTVYGMISRYGIQAMIYNNYYHTSSGAGTGEFMDTWLVHS
jgi:hypothetical protein